jgi:isoquinoline 1-oxidoreductase subunit beta
LRRRAWLLSAAGTAGALVVGWGLLPARSRQGAPDLWRANNGEVALNGWIKIAADGAIVLAMPRSEMGQGIHTALPMLVAEELDVPLGRVRIEQAGVDAIYGNVAMLVASLPFHPLESEGDDKAVKVKLGEWVVGKVARELGINATGGSSSVGDGWMVLRTAAATVRASLLGAASLQWRLPVNELAVEAGVVSHPSGKSATYGDLAKFAVATPPGNVVLKDRKQWRLIGHSAPRRDVAAKVDGSARFGLDIRLPGMVYAAVRLCPTLGGSPGAIRADAVLAQPGVERLVRLPAYADSTAGFAVVARTSWHAKQAAAAVEVQWHLPPVGVLDTEEIEKKLETAVREREGFAFYVKGEVEDAERGAVRVLES